MPTQPERRPPRVANTARTTASTDPAISDVERLAGQLKKASPMQAVALAQQLASAARTAREAQPKPAARRRTDNPASASTNDDATFTRLLNQQSE